MLKVLLCIVSTLIIILTLIKGGESNGINGFTGNNSNLALFKNTKEVGFGKALERAILILTIIFFILVFII